MKKHAFTLVFVIACLFLTVSCTSQAQSDERLSLPEKTASMAQPADHQRSSRQPASGLYFLNSQIGWGIFGEGLYQTSNGGKTWTLVYPGDINLQKIIFTDEQNGWGYTDDWGDAKRSSSVYRTQDGGRTWHEILEIGTPMYSIDFLDRDVGLACGRWHPFQLTTDGGKTWKDGLMDNGGETREDPYGASEGARQIYYFNDREGYGYGLGIWRTKDGGRRWSAVVPHREVKAELRSGSFPNNESGCVVGDDGEVWHSRNGYDWQKSTELPLMTPSLSSVDFINPKEGWISGVLEYEGNKTGGEGIVLHTKDGGATWELSARWPNGIAEIRFTDEREGWAVDWDGNLLHSVDAGRSWNAYDVAGKASSQPEPLPVRR